MQGIGSKRLIVVAAMTAAALWPSGPATAGGGCHGAPTNGTGDVVTLVDLCFTPSVLHVDPGTEVTFLNKDPIAHNVTASLWASNGDLLQGDTFSATFDEEGTFPYACMYHYGMTGAIVVGDGSGPASGASVDTGSVVDSMPVSEERATSATTERSGLLGWAVAGLIGLLVGAGLTAMLRRRRLKD
jgi:plastocyanin